MEDAPDSWARASRAATIDGRFTLKTGPENDTFSKLNGTTIAGKETVKLGGGTNTVAP